MWRSKVLVHALFTGILAGPAVAQTPVIFGFTDTKIQLAVRRAVEGAAVRLARPSCQEVLSDFTDQSGQRLSAKLQASGRSVAEAFGLLRFVDDRAALQCRRGPSAAFTLTGSRLIRVCGRQFRDRDQIATEIIVIHEFLHALGLGENPPTSKAITEQVAARCAAR
jgi:hypothetical protein